MSTGIPSGGGSPLLTKEAGALSEAIVRTTRQPFLVLDGHLVVEAANPAFLETFHVDASQTQGQCLYDLGNGQWNIPELRVLMNSLLREQSRISDYRVEHKFEHIGKRIMLLNAERIACDGTQVLLAISDMTERENLLFELEAAREFAEMTVDSLRDPLLVLDWSLRVRSGNTRFYDTFQVSRHETRGKLIYELGNGQWNIPRLRQLLEDVLPDNNAFDNFEVEHDFDTLGHRVMMLNARRLNHHQSILLVIEDVTEKRRGESQARAVMGELQHRVKNILANVRALARQTRLRSPDLATFATNFDRRLDALARTQDLLLRSKGDAIDLAELLRLELGACSGHEGESFFLAGPPIEMPARFAQAMAMTAHELGTNAAKYGAFASPRGRIELKWHVERLDSGRQLHFAWHEHGVALSEAPGKPGFGTQFIEKMLPYTMGGTAAIRYGSDGIRCSIVVPLDDGNKKRSA